MTFIYIYLSLGLSNIFYNLYLKYRILKNYFCFTWPSIYTSFLGIIFVCLVAFFACLSLSFFVSYGQFVLVPFLYFERLDKCDNNYSFCPAAGLFACSVLRSALCPLNKPWYLYQMVTQTLVRT